MSFHSLTWVTPAISEPLSLEDAGVLPGVLLIKGPRHGNFNVLDLE